MKSRTEFIDGVRQQNGIPYISSLRVPDNRNSLPINVEVVSRSTKNVVYKSSKIRCERLDVRSKESKHRNPV